MRVKYDITGELIKDGQAAAAAAAGFGSAGELSKDRRQKGQVAAAAADDTKWGAKPANHGELARVGRQKGQAVAAAAGRTDWNSSLRRGRPRGSKDQKPRKVKKGYKREAQSGADHWTKRCKVEHGANGRPRRCAEGGVSVVYLVLLIISPCVSH